VRGRGALTLGEPGRPVPIAAPQCTYHAEHHAMAKSWLFHFRSFFHFRNPPTAPPPAEPLRRSPTAPMHPHRRQFSGKSSSQRRPTAWRAMARVGERRRDAPCRPRRGSNCTDPTAPAVPTALYMQEQRKELGASRSGRRGWFFTFITRGFSRHRSQHTQGHVDVRSGSSRKTTLSRPSTVASLREGSLSELRAPALRRI
jgi:hypothetical protein